MTTAIYILIGAGIVLMAIAGYSKRENVSYTAAFFGLAAFGGALVLVLIKIFLNL